MLKAVIHIAVAFSVFLSSGGIWLNSHYCKDEFVKTSFFFSFGSCCAKNAATPCSRDEEDHKEDKNCCHNESTYFKLDQDQQIPITGIDVTDRPASFSAILPPQRILLPSFDKQYLPFLNYAPPLVVYDRQVWLQSFLC